MKIKTQFRLFILGIIAIPIIFMIAIPTYMYITSPERLFIKAFKELKENTSYPLTAEEWDLLYQDLRHSPPGVKIAIILNDNAVLLSTIPELKKGPCSIDVFYNLLNSSDKYFYQFAPLPTTDPSVVLTIIIRASRDTGKKQHFFYKLIIPALILFAAFEFFCIFIVVQISTTISRSITMLENRTKRIAEGDLDTKLQITPHRDSNEITTLTENLEKMRESLKEDRERRSRFIMGISHDLRTPVAVIKGYTEAISDGIASDPESIHNAVEIIESKTNQLEGMIDTLINFEKLNSHDWRSKLTCKPLKPAIIEFMKSAEMTGDIFKHSVHTNIDIQDTARTPFDSLLFQRAMENLFTNAIRYSGENSIITISAIQQESNVIITIQDDGVGIEPEDLKHIFEMFYRGSSSRREQGMGIGLAVVKNIIDTHGWTITVNSAPHQGTAFTITIPISNQDCQDKEA
ncbi:MAG: HAMP domain-containing histidine kinase [Treponema sp.]|nr:HAMP domain-containing histidine kinase [Treponema sp.]